MAQRAEFTGEQRNPAWSAAANVILPYVCFVILKKAGLSDTHALIAVSVFPALKVLWDWVRSRTVDVLGCIVLWELVLLAFVGLTFHNPRLLLLKGPIQVTALGVVCLFSLAVRRPLAGVAARFVGNPALNFGGANISHFRDAEPERLRRVTLAWGLLCLVDAAGRTAMIFTMPVGPCLLVSRVFHVAVFASLSVWTFRSLMNRSSSSTTAAEAR
ncbi:MAG: VC0807 family protein [Capsulimonadaceae bacterium]